MYVTKPYSAHKNQAESMGKPEAAPNNRADPVLWLDGTWASPQGELCILRREVGRMDLVFLMFLAFLVGFGVGAHVGIVGTERVAELWELAAAIESVEVEG